MKKLLVLFMISIVLAGCNRGFNRSILEPLSVEELKSNLKKDTTFADFYSEIQKLREYLMGSDINQAKYADITYGRVYRYYNKISDTTFVNQIFHQQRELYDEKFPDYEKEVDSILTYWKEYRDEYALDSFVKVQYKELWKEYYSYSHGLRNVNIGFLITPLKGTIEQLVFRYCIKSKISNDGKMSLWDSHRCLASSPIYSPEVLYWEADYSDEEYLKNKTSAQVAREYDFNIEIVEVRVNGENVSEKLDAIPQTVSRALFWEDSEYMHEYYAAEIVKEMIDPSYISFRDFCRQALEEELKEKDPEVYALFKEWHSFDSEGDKAKDY